MYKQNCSLQTTSLNDIKSAWEEELDEEIRWMMGRGTQKRVHTSICAQPSLIHCTVIHRARWTKCSRTGAPIVHGVTGHMHILGLSTSWNEYTEVSGTQTGADPLIVPFRVSSPTTQLTWVRTDVTTFQCDGYLCVCVCCVRMLDCEIIYFGNTRGYVYIWHWRYQGEEYFFFPS